MKASNKCKASWVSLWNNLKKEIKENNLLIQVL